MSKDLTVKLSVEETSWSGQAARVGEPTSTVTGKRIYDVKRGETIHLNYAGNYYPLEIKQVDKELIILHTENLNAEGFSEGNPLRPESLDVNLHKGKFVILKTPTLDSGMKWKVTLL